MGIVRTIIWVLLTALLVVFSTVNWVVVPVQVWPNLIVETKLPAIVLISFLIGFLPTWLAWRAARWSLKRRLDHSERQLTDLRAMANRPAEPIAAPVVPVEPVPVATPSATPTDLFPTDKP
ncbi:DUF1049 domain-containing protein [Sphingopyxis sp. KK2]|uniref:DUF1049 domain-containing protein n=1 Tax=Sphingopyxis sp. KK2 TaxID=1855727 RepID=UPI00097E6176|nr:DUF1049 domain-containing protein [Sphingopyxis sp. KK2]